jgi:hypothetical protein
VYPSVEEGGVMVYPSVEEGEVMVYPSAEDGGVMLYLSVEELCIIFSIYSILSYAIQGAQVLIDLLCFDSTFSNISAISWRPVLVVEEAGVPGENHRPWASNW